MKLICYSVTYHEAPLEIREKLSFTELQQRALLQQLGRHPAVQEAMVLCTCNRTEVYLSGADQEMDQILVDCFKKTVPAADRPWEKYHTKWTQDEAIRHLFSVAAGLDSQMIGEHQIISQVKAAYTMSIEEKTSQFLFHRLLHRAFRASKEVRSRTCLQAGSVSIASAAIRQASGMMNLPGASVLLLGAGENAEEAARLVHKAGIGKLWIASRTMESAKRLAAAIRFGQPVEFERSFELLKEADLAICTTASPTPLITAADAAYLLSQRTKPIVIVDIAVPRDVDPQVGSLEMVRLMNIDDLEAQVQANKEIFEKEIEKAESIITDHAQRFSRWLASLDVSETVTQLVETYNEMAQKEARRYRRYFNEDDRDRLEKFARSLVKKLLHQPISYLKDSNGDVKSPERLHAVDLIQKIMLKPDDEKGRKSSKK